MSKAEKIQPNSQPDSEHGSSAGARSPARAALAEAIRVRDEAQAEDEVLRQARERAKADRFLAFRDVEAATGHLNRARDMARESLVGAYVDGDEGDGGRVIAEAEAELHRAQRRAAELSIIEQELNARTSPAPGRSIPNMRVDEAVRAVVKTHPTVRRLVTDWQTAERSFRMYEATLIWLAGHAMIPPDLERAAPSKNATRYSEPDESWLAAIEALKKDADAELPE